jgi:succinate dehydrogenase/fumarate reductase flavoprotein subunit
MGGIPANYHGEAISPANGNPDATVVGLMAAGEAACVSVHGANRLGCNSLLDIVVFGRAAALRCAEELTAKAKQPQLPGYAAGVTLARFDRLRHAKVRNADRCIEIEDAAGHADLCNRVPDWKNSGRRQRSFTHRMGRNV